MMPSMDRLNDELEHATTETWHNQYDHPSNPYHRDDDPRTLQVQQINATRAHRPHVWRGSEVPAIHLTDGRWRLIPPRPSTTYLGRPVVDLGPVAFPDEFSLDYVETWTVTPPLDQPGPYRWTMESRFDLRGHNAPMRGNHPGGPSYSPTDPNFQEDAWFTTLPEADHPNGVLGIRYETRALTFPEI